MVKAETMTRAILEHQRVVPVGLADCLTEARPDASVDTEERERSERPINADVPRVDERPGDDDGFVGMGPGVDYETEAREF